MIRLVLHLLAFLMASERQPQKNLNKWTPAADKYLRSMDIEWQIMYLEHCLELDSSRHYQSNELRDY